MVVAVSCLFWSLFLGAVSSSKISANSLIALSWASPTGANGAPCLYCCNAAMRSFAAWVAASSANMCGSLVVFV
eukprot:6375417-Ditylum_brightwellii.AAC.1